MKANVIRAALGGAFGMLLAALGFTVITWQFWVLFLTALGWWAVGYIEGTQ